MTEIGIEVCESDLVLATVVAAEHIRKEMSNASVYVVGNKGLEETMEEYGLETTEVPGESNYVVVGNPFARDGRLRDGNDGKVTGAVRAILEKTQNLLLSTSIRYFPPKVAMFLLLGRPLKQLLIQPDVRLILLPVSLRSPWFHWHWKG
ncbi:hypothetical protein KGY79_09475 [Candidatus Bipolaricaulota bacterium]|nr:hypothetical protein [Candidatus Bipolaricaulota bacterium]